MLSYFACFLLIFVRITFYRQSVKHFKSRTGPTFYRAWSVSKLFAKVITRQQNMSLAGKELKHKEQILELTLNTYFTCRTTNNSIPKKISLSVMIVEIKISINIFINYSTGMYVLKIFFLYIFLKRPYFSVNLEIFARVLFPRNFALCEVSWK